MLGISILIIIFACIIAILFFALPPHTKPKQNMPGWNYRAQKELEKIANKV